ncbi:hypothetical protein RIF29_18869 [Crotalaria pallida]|uniref:Response regulatory domain-containing protein n=1 Tax=Crotalaria pallida TaxID=3830 RepID=A0AAN9I501_CROPI
MPIRKRLLKDTFIIDNALVVDNVTSARLMEQARLMSLGIHSMGVNNVVDAIEILEDDIHYFSLIVVDHDLPIMNGPQFVRQIRQMGVHRKILGVCTNYNIDKWFMFREAGANACIGKPFNDAILRETIEELRNDL